MKKTFTSKDQKDEEGLHPTCFRPDLFLDQDRFCDGCSYYSGCRCDIRRLKAEGPRTEGNDYN